MQKGMRGTQNSPRPAENAAFKGFVLPYSRQTSKPDLVVFPGTQQADVYAKRANKKAFRERQPIHLIEVGYTGDYGVHARVA